MHYQHATWRIQLAKDMFVEVSLKGLDSDRGVCDAKDVIQAGAVVKDVGQALDRIVERWAFTRKGAA